jgi:hypothetical protein
MWKVRNFNKAREWETARLKMEICKIEKRKIFVRDKGRKLISHPGGSVYVL